MSAYKKVTAPVLWDNDSTFQGGRYYTVSSSAIVVGTVNKPTGPVIPGVRTIPALVPTLQIKDPEYNDLYLAMTFEEWIALVGMANGSAGIPESVTFTGGDTIPAGNTISSPLLKNIIILSVNKSGISIYNYVYTNGSPNGTLNLTADGGLAVDEKIQIIYKRA